MNQPTAEATVDEALRRLVDVDISADSRESLYAYAHTLSNPQDRAAAVAYLVLASPEYQLI
jgi:ABC-type dipeptide/oligopeptide/nickel transport system ATPase component